MSDYRLRNVINRLCAAAAITMPLCTQAAYAVDVTTKIAMEPHLTVSAMHEKARLAHLHGSLLANPDYRSLHSAMSEAGLKTHSSLIATYFESSVEGEDVSYGILACEGPIPYCINTKGQFDINHYRVSFYAERLLRESELLVDIIKAINYQENITAALRKGPIVSPEDITDGAKSIIDTRAHFYQLMHENGAMGLSGIVSAPEALSLSLFNAGRVNKMSSYFSDAFASLDTYIRTDISDTKVLTVSNDDVDVSLSLSTSIDADGKSVLKKAFFSAFESGKRVDLMGEGSALYWPEYGSVAVIGEEDDSFSMCLAKLPESEARLPADHVKMFNLIKHSEMRMDYLIGKVRVDVPLISNEKRSYQVRIPYEDETRTRRLKTSQITCDVALSFRTRISTTTRVNVDKKDISSIQWTGELLSNL